MAAHHTLRLARVAGCVGFHADRQLIIRTIPAAAAERGAPVAPAAHAVALRLLCMPICLGKCAEAAPEQSCAGPPRPRFLGRRGALVQVLRERAGQRMTRLSFAMGVARACSIWVPQGRLQLRGCTGAPGSPATAWPLLRRLLRN